MFGRYLVEPDYLYNEVEYLSEEQYEKFQEFDNAQLQRAIEEVDPQLDYETEGMIALDTNRGAREVIAHLLKVDVADLGE